MDHRRRSISYGSINHRSAELPIKVYSNELPKYLIVDSSGPTHSIDVYTHRYMEPRDPRQTAAEEKFHNCEQESGAAAVSSAQFTDALTDIRAMYLDLCH